MKMLWTAELMESWCEKFSDEGFEINFASGAPIGKSSIRLAEDEFIEKMQDIDVIMLGYDKLTRNVIENSPKLKLVICIKDGPEEAVDIQACTQKGIPIISAGGRCIKSVAEYNMLLILALARPIITINNKMRNEKWTNENKAAFRDIVEQNSIEIGRRSVGIIGIGRNGFQLAKFANGFGMKIYAFDPYANPELAKQENIELVTLDELLTKSDFVVMMARLTKDNEKMISTREFSLMKNSAYFINTARSKLVDTQSMIEALKNGTIKAAAIDVFDQEPLSVDDPLYDIPEEKLIMTNHIAGFTQDRVNNQFELVYEHYQNYKKGIVPRTLAKKEVFEAKEFKDRGGILWNK